MRHKQAQKEFFGLTVHQAGFLSALGFAFPAQSVPDHVLQPDVLVADRVREGNWGLIRGPNPL